MLKWPKASELEGTVEIHLRWWNLAIIAAMIIVPLALALAFDSWWIKIPCWLFSLAAYVSCLRVQGPCVMATAVGALPWYILLEWNFAPSWLMLVAAVITLIEISYIRHRMHIIADFRTKEGVL